jgi:hypothetical protein
MFCPKCASQNLEGASFCRTCGANISLVPQALSGQLPEALDEPEGKRSRRARRKAGRELKLDHAFKNIFMGIAFLVISIALSYSRTGMGWWFWMLIPAFSMMGTGIAQVIRIREEQKRMPPHAFPVQASMPAPPTMSHLPPRNTGEMIAPPPSVTEGTTRHLGAEAPTRHLDASGEPHN